MTIKQISIATIAGIIAITATPAQALKWEEDFIRKEAQACFAAISEHVGRENVEKIRHTVVDFDYATIGYAVKIRSEFVTPDGEQEYKTKCISNGRHDPLKLRVREING